MTNEPRFVKLFDFIVVVLPLVIFGLHTALVNGWIVDDAAITFAYARNLADGHGLVSQPQMPPVEGYSNFAWLMLTLPFHLLNLFHPIVTPKLISAVLIAITYTVIFLMLRPVRYGRWMAFAGLSLVSLNTSFVMWCVSGLENPLYVLLIVLLGLIMSHFVNTPAPLYLASGAGGIAALTAMTRPDGLVYAAGFAALMAVVSRHSLKTRIKSVIVYGLTFTALYGGFLLFRLAYFGELMPNTYTMKGGPKFYDLIDILTLKEWKRLRFEGLMESIGGEWTAVLCFVLIGATVFMLLSRRFTRVHLVLLGLGACAALIYLLLPPDWMEEYRFATPFFLFFYVFLAGVVVSAISLLPKRIHHPLLATSWGLAFIFCLVFFAPRSLTFAVNPTVPMMEIVERFAVRFEIYRQTFDLEEASVLLPDVGGMLYYSDLAVYDLAGLTNRTIAQTLGKKINRPAFHDYVFEEAKPTFIHMHGFWTVHSKLGQDERLARDYVPVCEYLDTWATNAYGSTYYSGDYVRREFVEARPLAISRLQPQLDETCNLRDSRRLVAMLGIK